MSSNLLCDVCRNCLENVFPMEPLGPYQVLGQPGPMYLETTSPSLVYGHHPTEDSLLRSRDARCFVCSDERLARRNGSTKSEPPEIAQYGFFSVFWFDLEAESEDQLDRLYLEICCGRSRAYKILQPTTQDDNVVITLQPSTDSPQTRATIDYWIRTCLQSHNTCISSRENYIPTRLLHLTDSETFRLVLRSECPPNSRYMTLSYCWGSLPAEEHFRLTRTTYEQLRAPQAINTLARTFREAMSVTQRLGCHYLWIDRLCIYQDSVEDWSIEAVSMQDVYGHSFLNIGALASTDDRGGLFRDNSSTREGPPIVNIQSRDGDDATPCTFQDTLFSVVSDLANFQGPLLKRGWVFQERLLAPRGLFFGRQQVFWECRERLACEVYPITMDKRNRHIEMGSHEISKKDSGHIWKRTLGVHRQECKDSYQQYFLDWRYIVEAYSNCSLSRSSDKLVALSGLANDMKSFLDARYPTSRPHNYYAGSWGADLLNSLCWYTYEISSKSGRYHAPSWSWASIDIPIRFDEMSTYEISIPHRVYQFISSCRAETWPENKEGTATSRVSAGKIDVTAPISTIKGVFPDSGDVTSNWVSFTHFVNCANGEEQNAFFRYLSDGSAIHWDAAEKRDTTNMYCIPTRIIVFTGHTSWTSVSAIVLTHYKALSKEYRRIGYIHYSITGGESGKELARFFSRCPQVSITIV